MRQITQSPDHCSNFYTFHTILPFIFPIYLQPGKKGSGTDGLWITQWCKHLFARTTELCLKSSQAAAHGIHTSSLMASKGYIYDLCVVLLIWNCLHTTSGGDLAPQVYGMPGAVHNRHHATSRGSSPLLTPVFEQYVVPLHLQQVLAIACQASELYGMCESTGTVLWPQDKCAVFWVLKCIDNAHLSPQIMLTNTSAQVAECVPKQIKQSRTCGDHMSYTVLPAFMWTAGKTTCQPGTTAIRPETIGSGKTHTLSWVYYKQDNKQQINDKIICSRLLNDMQWYWMHMLSGLGSWFTHTRRQSHWPEEWILKSCEQKTYQHRSSIPCTALTSNDGNLYNMNSSFCLIGHIHRTWVTYICWPNWHTQLHYSSDSEQSVTVEYWLLLVTA